jgi:hypothetical protein
MGIHGNATCVMNYEGATGFLVGEAHKGMRTMFVMMNEARLGVGMRSPRLKSHSRTRQTLRVSVCKPLDHWR